MANLHSVIKPGEHILWQKDKPGTWDYFWAFIKPSLSIIGMHVLTLAFLLIGFYVTTPQPSAEKLASLFAIAIGAYPVLAGMFLLYYITMLGINLSALAGDLALTDQRFLKMTGNRLREIQRCDIKNMMLGRGGKLSFIHQSGKKSKVSGFDIGRANVAAFKQAYHG